MMSLAEQGRHFQDEPLDLMNQLFNQIKKVHFIGIGGIGVSALARMMLFNEKQVIGSDLTKSPITERIRKSGARVLIGHQASNLAKDTDLVIYSPAVKDNNPELNKARQLKIPCYSYPQALGLISQDKYTIAVSGAHGKTTTTAMIAEILISAKKSPTVIVGSLLKKQKDNFIPGQSKYFVVEACEYQKSFLNLQPDILVITNIDDDHLDYYRTLKNIQKAFAQLAAKVPQKGFIVCNPKDAKVKPILKKSSQVIDYTREKIAFKLKVPGSHNISNAQAALSVARILKINSVKTKQALKNFSGTWRRFEYKGKTKSGAFIYDDYAHHPTEIRATLKAAREQFPKRKIIVVFQPHLYSRTKLLLRDFAKSFVQADEIIIADIYAAREKNDQSIHSRDLVKKIQKHKKGVQYIPSFSKIEKYLKINAQKNDLIITMGAGDVYLVGEEIIGK